MEKAQYAKYLFETNLPIADCERVKTFISDQFGFDRAFVNIKDKGIGYPLFKDGYNNYIIFQVKSINYSCVDGKLDILNREKVR